MSVSSFVHLTEWQVSELADGTLDSREHPIVLAHLGRCSGCRAEVAETRALLARARDARAGTVAPPELWPLVAGATIGARRRTTGAALGLTRLLIVVAFAIFAVSLAMSMRARLRAGGGAPTVPAAGASAPPIPTAPPMPAAPPIPATPAVPAAPAPDGGARR